MGRFFVMTLVLAGCLQNHTVEVDHASLDVPRGGSTDVMVSIDGDAVFDLDEVLWVVDDPDIATVTRATDGRHVRIGGNLEGETIVHINSYGQTIDIPTRIGPPAIVEMWIEPPVVSTSIGHDVPVKALALDTLFRVRDITHDSRWSVRDPDVASLDHAGMMLSAQREGRTTLHATNGTSATVIPITIFK